MNEKEKKVIVNIRITPTNDCFKNNNNKTKETLNFSKRMSSSYGSPYGAVPVARQPIVYTLFFMFLILMCLFKFCCDTQQRGVDPDESKPFYVLERPASWPLVNFKLKIKIASLRRHRKMNKKLEFHSNIWFVFVFLNDRDSFSILFRL